MEGWAIGGNFLTQEYFREDPNNTNKYPFTTVLEDVRDNICVCDRTGKILWVNKAWRRFCVENGGDDTKTGVGTNYLSVCDSAAESVNTGNQDAVAFREGLERLLASETFEEFSMEYPCDSPDQERWCCVQAYSFPVDSTVFMVIIHKNDDDETCNLNSTGEINTTTQQTASTEKVKNSTEEGKQELGDEKQKDSEQEGTGENLLRGETEEKIVNGERNHEQLAPEGTDSDQKRESVKRLIDRIDGKNDNPETESKKVKPE